MGDLVIIGFLVFVAIVIMGMILKPSGSPKFTRTKNEDGSYTFNPMHNTEIGKLGSSPEERYDLCLLPTKKLPKAFEFTLNYSTASCKLKTKEIISVEYKNIVQDYRYAKTKEGYVIYLENNPLIHKLLQKYANPQEFSVLLGSQV